MKSMKSVPCGRSSKSCSRCRPRCSPKSPGAATSGRPRPNMRNIWAVQRPTPACWVRSSMTASSVIWASARKLMSPATVACASPCRKRALLAESPAARNLGVGSDAIAAASRRPPDSVATRLPIVRAAAVDNCCPMMEPPRHSNAVRRPRSMGQRGCALMTLARPLSRAVSSRNARAMSALFMRVFTGQPAFVNERSIMRGAPGSRQRRSVL